jgi:hypothetical protein
MGIFSSIGSMIAPGVGTAIGAGLDLAGTVIGAGMQSSAAKDAARTQATAADQATAEARRQFDTTRQDMSPWMQSGRNSLRKLDSLLGTGPTGSSQYGGAVQNYQDTIGRYQAAQQEYAGLWGQRSSPARDARIAQLSGEISQLGAQAQQYLTEANQTVNQPADPERGSLMRDFSLQDFQTDPGYQFRLGEGAKAIENSAAARGMQLSGANLKGLTRFNQDFASNEYGNAWNRDSNEKQRKYNFLTGQSGQGQQTAAQVGGFGANASGQIADNYLQAGNARAAGQVGSASAWGNAIGDVSDYYRLRNLLRPGAASSSSAGYGAAPGFGSSRSLGLG